MARCAGITGAGERCRAQALHTSEYCYYHAPELERQRAANNRKGGKRGGRGRLSPHTAEIAAVKADLKEIVSDVREGKLATSKGNTIASLLHVLMRAIEADLKTVELALALQERLELVQRMEQLEQLLADKNEAGRWGA